MVQLAEAVATSAAVEVSPASMFALLLVQVHLNKYEPSRVRRPRRRRKTASKSRKSTRK